MFHKLHLQFTVFCTVVTGAIVLLLSFLCLFFAGKSIQESDAASFLRELNSVLLPLQEQDIIFHQWMNQIQEQGQIKLFLYDHGVPFYYQNYHPSVEDETLQSEVIAAAKNDHQMDIFVCETKQIIRHVEFDFLSSSKKHFMVSAGVIPKQESYLSFLILYPLEKQKAEMKRLRLMMCLADLAAVCLLFVFSWFFTGHILIPLEKSRKNQMNFIASASHELRAPLAVIRSGLEVIAKTDSPEERKRSMRYMEEESERMQNLIRDMLLLANADSGNLPFHIERCEPEELLLSVYEKYEPFARKKRISLSILLPEEQIASCFCDREKMTQVLSILVDNAISYTPDEGRITLRLTYEEENVCFSVSDTGSGIPAAEKEQIFDRFFRADQSHTDKSHFGLGLCIAKEIVQKHQGKIRVEDVSGGGSCFVVTIPLNAF